MNTTADGSTGLLVVAANNNLTIIGKGATIGRSTAAGTPAFHLFDAAAGAALTLNNLTIANGRATDKPGSCGTPIPSLGFAQHTAACTRAA